MTARRLECFLVFFVLSVLWTSLLARVWFQNQKNLFWKASARSCFLFQKSPNMEKVFFAIIIGSCYSFLKTLHCIYMNVTPNWELLVKVSQLWEVKALITALLFVIWQIRLLNLNSRILFSCFCTHRQANSLVTFPSKMSIAEKCSNEEDPEVLADQMNTLHLPKFAYFELLVK